MTAREKQVYQEHFIDLCHLVDHQTPNDYHPTGPRFGFEMDAATSAQPHRPLVFAAYRWKSDLSDEEISEKLLALNLERAKVEQTEPG